MAYGDFKYLPTKTASDKLLCDKIFDIAKNVLVKRRLKQQESDLMQFLISNRWQKNYANQILDYLKIVKCIHPLRTTFGLFI